MAMAARKQLSAPSSNQIGEGLDTLWKFQLRKENAALLEKLEENAKVVEACKLENMRQFQCFSEKIACIEATIANIERMEEKGMEAWKLQSEEVAALKNKLDNFIQDDIPSATADSGQRNDEEAASSSPRLTDLLVPAHDRHLASSLDILSNTSIDLADSSSNIKDSIPISPMAVPSDIATKITASRKQPTPTSNVKQNTPASGSTLSQTPSRLRYKTADFPRLVQGSSCSLRAYHTSASKAFAKLTLDKSGEVEFVARFVKGIHTASHRSTLLKELEKTNPSFTESGEQKILCEWNDVADALRSSRMIEPKEATGAPPAKKKRRVLIPPEMIKDGMVRQYPGSEI